MAKNLFPRETYRNPLLFAVRKFREWVIAIKLEKSFTKQEIIHMISNHHRPDLSDVRHKTTALLYFAELLDEMITLMPHKVRYNFDANQIRHLGERFMRRNGLMNVLLALIKLYKGKGLAGQIVSSLVMG